MSGDAARLWLLARNRVVEFARFRRAFDADLERAARAGLTLEALWRSADDPLDVHFLFAVADRARAEAFMASPESADSGDAAGVVDGDYHWLVGEPGPTPGIGRGEH